MLYVPFDFIWLTSRSLKLRTTKPINKIKNNEIQSCIGDEIKCLKLVDQDESSSQFIENSQSPISKYWVNHQNQNAFILVIAFQIGQL